MHPHLTLLTCLRHLKLPGASAAILVWCGQGETKFQLEALLAPPGPEKSPDGGWGEAPERVSYFRMSDVLLSQKKTLVLLSNKTS